MTKLTISNLGISVSIETQDSVEITCLEDAAFRMLGLINEMNDRLNKNQFKPHFLSQKVDIENGS